MDVAAAIPDEGWSIRADAPGARDLGCPDVWAHSQVRSARRRAAAHARRPGLAAATPAKVSAALVTATLLAPTLQSAQAHETGQAAETAAGSTLQRGDRGGAVKALQRALGITADGVFGPQTAKAVRAAQRDRGMEADGVVGAPLAQALGVNLGAGAGAGARPRSLALTGAGTVVLDRAATRALQRAVGVRADGAIGPQTRAAIKRAEKRLGLPADGRPDSELLNRLGVAAGGGDTEAGGEREPAGEPAPSSGSSDAGAAVAAAQAAIGTPYGSGGNGPDAYDCSGLTVHAFKAAGISLPRTSFAQYGQGTRVDRSQIRAGDLVFFDTNGPGASHVGVATGPTTVVSATSHGVKEHSFSSGYWAGHYVGARRVA
ncbi:MAG TPA: NlpC/P60 family protein [Baekduia sp.]|nr:NlpC/P60 family protein [Baekduia sp.]